MVDEGRIRSRSSNNGINWNRKEGTVKRDRRNCQYLAVISDWTTADLFSKKTVLTMAIGKMVNVLITAELNH